jgi:aspartokinase
MAKTIAIISYAEAIEMAYFGAKRNATKSFGTGCRKRNTDTCQEHF